MNICFIAIGERVFFLLYLDNSQNDQSLKKVSKSNLIILITYVS